MPKRTPGQNARRQDDYNRWVGLGYTPAQASKLRDQSPATQKKTINQFPPPKAKSAPRNAGIRSKDQRLDVWRIWSADDGKEFPQDIAQVAADINDQAGYDAKDSYGYRALFHLFVENGRNIHNVKYDEDGSPILPDEVLDYADNYEEKAANS